MVRYRITPLGKVVFTTFFVIIFFALSFYVGAKIKAQTNKSTGNPSPGITNTISNSSSNPNPIPAKVSELNAKPLLVIRFDPDKSIIKTEDYTALDEFVMFSKTFYAYGIQIEGYTATTTDGGDSAYTAKLSIHRAEAVMKYLIESGIDPKRISISGKGPLNPVGDNNTESGRAMNRRAEISFITE